MVILHILLLMVDQLSMNSFSMMWQFNDERGETKMMGIWRISPFFCTILKDDSIIKDSHPFVKSII
jgi:hypothetical protein